MANMENEWQSAKVYSGAACSSIITSFHYCAMTGVVMMQTGGGAKPLKRGRPCRNVAPQNYQVALAPLHTPWSRPLLALKLQSFEDLKAFPRAKPLAHSYSRVRFMRYSLSVDGHTVQQKRQLVLKGAIKIVTAESS
mgnify:CR=1 FL=1